MKLRVNQPAPTIKYTENLGSNTILIEEFLKMTVQIFKAMRCDKVSWLQSPGLYVVTRETERRKVRSHGAHSDWEYFWLIAQLKTRYIPRYCLYHGR